MTVDLKCPPAKIAARGGEHDQDYVFAVYEGSLSIVVRPPYILVCLTSFFFAAVLGACVPVAQIQYDPIYAPTAPPSRFDDHDWAQVLRENVRDGLVNYVRLAENREPLDKFLGLISVVGPESTPTLFRTPSDQMCYYLNAYNACVLRAVLEQYPTASIHRLDTPRLEFQYLFRVDRQNVKLADIREKLVSASRGDVRVDFCLCEASVGSPRLSSESYRAENLREHLRKNARALLANPHLLHIDHERRELFLWSRIVSNSERCAKFYQRVTGSGRVDLINFLMYFAEPSMRQRLARAEGYAVKRMPIDRRLNDLNLRSVRELSRSD